MPIANFISNVPSALFGYLNLCVKFPPKRIRTRNEQPNRFLKTFLSKQFTSKSFKKPKQSVIVEQNES